MRRTVVLSSVLLMGVCGVWIHGAQQQPAPAQQAPAINPDNFSGKVTSHSTSDIRMLRYSFEPGARTNWHSHAGGQVIYIEEGRMVAQERGQRAKELGSGDTLRVARDIVHWHGASPKQGLTQVSLSFGMTAWMEKVSDHDYGAATKR